MVQFGPCTLNIVSLLALMDPQLYCQAIVRKSGSSFYYPLLRLPTPQRDAMIALYAFCRAVDDVVDDIDDPAVAEKKLLWWQEEINKLFYSTPTHPITQALKRHHLRYAWPAHLFEDLLRGMWIDLKGPSFQNFEALEDYCYCVAGTVGLLATYVFGYTKATTLDYAKHLGTSLQLINIIRDVGEDIRRNRLYLPLDELKRFNINPNQLIHRQYQDHDLKPLLCFQAERARNYYTKAMSLLAKEDRKNQRTGLMMAQIYLSLLQAIEEEDFQVLNQKIKLTPLKKICVAIGSFGKETLACL